MSACGGKSPSQPACTEITPSCQAPTPSFQNDVLPLLNRSCNTASCHVAGGGPWPLDTYQDVTAWASPVQLDTEACTMPPANAGVPPLTDAERTILLDWIACGMPQ